MDAPSLSTGRPKTPLRRAPLATAAGAFALGIAAGRYGPLGGGFWGALGGAALLAAAAMLPSRRLHLATAVAVGLAVASAGALRARLARFSLPEDHVATYAPFQPIPATLRGQAVTAPQVLPGNAPEGMSYDRPPQTAFLLRAAQIRTDAGWRNVSGLVQVIIAEPADALRAGQQLELVGTLARLRPPDNPGQHDWASAAAERGVWARLTVPAAEGATVRAGADQPAWSRALWNLRAAARQEWAHQGEGGQLLAALLLGERDPALRELNRTMAAAGVAHFLSISGLHLGIFLGFLYLLCRLVTLSPRRAAAVVLVVLASYVLLAEPRPPLLRSALMAAMLCLATILHRRYVALNAVAAAAIILLAFQPLELFQAGFQLSFATVAGLIVLHGPLRQALFGRWLRVRGLMVFRGDQRLQRWLHYSAANWAMDAVTMCLAAYLAAAPLVAHHFGLFSPYAPALSLLLLPAVTAVLVPGYLSLALAWPLPNLSHLLSRAARSAAEGLAWAARGFEALPGLSFAPRPVGPAWVVLCYATLGALLVHRRLPLGRLWAAGAVVALAGATIVTQLPAPAPRLAELDILAVGSGQCALLRTPSGQTFLLDAGTAAPFDANEAVLAPFLRCLRLPAPAEAFVSHANADHYNALPALLRDGTLRRVYLNDSFGPDDPPDSPAAELIRQIADHRVEVRRLRAGDAVDLDERTRVEVLWPPAEAAGLAVNDTSLVLRIRCDDRAVLLTGDIEQAPQAALAASADLRADVLLLPHHGAWKPALPAFVAAVAPDVVVASAAADPAGRGEIDDPSRHFFTQLRAGRRFYSTARHGWVQVRFGRGRVEVQTCRD